MAGELVKIVDWIKKNGEVKAVDRVRVMVLPQTMAEGIRLASIDATTKCSAALLQAVRGAASTVVGKPCPI